MREPVRGIADGGMSGRTCPYCRFPLKEGVEMIACGECHAAHHVDCWADNAGCAVMGCAAAPAATEATEEATQVTPGMPPVAPGTGKLHISSDEWPARSVPQSPPPPPPATQPGRRPRPLGLSFAVVLLALAIAGAATALLLTKSKNHSITITQVKGRNATETSTTDANAQTSSTDTSSSDASSTSDSTTSAMNESPGAASPAPGDVGSNGPEAAFRHYWDLVNNGDYHDAFLMETGDEHNAEPSFESDKQAARPKIAIASVGPTSFSSHGEADVTVDFYSQDQNPAPGSDTLCREFTGTAVMVKSGGAWLYGRPQYNATVHNDLSYPNCHA